MFSKFIKFENTTTFLIFQHRFFSAEIIKVQEIWNTGKEN